MSELKKRVDIDIKDRLYDYNTPADNDFRCEVAEYIERLEGVLNEFVTENCDRVGDEDWPDIPDNQSTPLVGKAMRILDL